MNNQIVSNILIRPDAYLIVEAVKSALDKEEESRSNFLDEISEEDRSEFINGEIVKPSPECLRDNRVSALLLRLLGIYVMKLQLGDIGSGRLMITLTRNAYHPDICFFNKEKSKCFQDDQTLFPAPDFIAEIISDSTEHRDRGVKFDDYEAHSITEYWIIDPENQFLEQYHLKEGKYELILKSDTGTVTSVVIAGFQIPVQAIFNEAENQKILQSFLASPSV